MAIQDLRAISDGLRLGEDGIWYGAAAEAISYPAGANALCAEIEEWSFWFRHRNDCILAAVQAFPPDGTLFDIGGGNGHVSTSLSANGYDVALLEPGLTGARQAARRGIGTVICASLATARFSRGKLPSVGLFDVLEHIKDDLRFLRDVHTAIRSGGRLYLTVPAYRALWSDEDMIAGHFRRYSLAETRAVLEASGFTVEFASYFFRPLPFAIALMRALPYRLGMRRRAATPDAVAREHGAGRPNATRLLALLTRGESERIAAKHPMHFGSSCLVVAKTA